MSINNRKHTRFPTLDPMATVEIDPNAHQSQFKPQYIGLPFSESFKGAGVIINKEASLKRGDMIKVKVGSLHPMLAQVVWVKTFDENFIKLGLELQE